MKKFISRLQKRSERERHTIVLATSIGVTGIIFAVWLTLFVGNVGQSDVVKSPFGVLTGQFSSLFGSMKNQFAAVTERFK